MAQAMSISEKIFRRWCEKLRNEKTIPKVLMESIQKLRKQGKLSNPEALGELLNQVGETNYDKD